MKVLITGVAGFIGSHLGGRLLADGHEVRLDNLDRQDPAGERPGYLARDVELQVGDARAGDVCIDVGAHIGYYTMLASRVAGPGGHVYAFEPS
jgi:nucleoside-diphosphate-sugar epimerase